MQTPVFMIIFLAPVYVPIDLLHGWVESAAHVNPITPIVEAARELHLRGATAGAAGLRRRPGLCSAVRPSGRSPACAAPRRRAGEAGCHRRFRGRRPAMSETGRDREDLDAARGRRPRAPGADRSQDDIDEAKADWESKKDDARTGPRCRATRRRRRTREGRLGAWDCTRERAGPSATSTTWGKGRAFARSAGSWTCQEMGVNAIVLPAGIDTGFHFHDRQEEVYFVHSGTVEIEFGDGTKHRLDAGGLARVAAATHRKTTTWDPTTPWCCCSGPRAATWGVTGRCPRGRRPRAELGSGLGGGGGRRGGGVRGRLGGRLLGSRCPSGVVPGLGVRS